LANDSSFATAILRGWWIILLIIVLSLVTAGLLTARQTPVYQSSGMLVAAPSSMASDTGEIIRSLETLERRTVIATFARIPTTREMREAVALELEVPAGQLRGYRINGSVVPNTNIIRIDVEGGDPEMVAKVANAVGDVTARESRDLYRVYSLRWLARANPARRPSFPDPQRNYLVGGVTGLVLGVAAALALGRGRPSGAVEASS
jgi:capsular polysaccharide biosynthesis protein